ncbi:polyphosphate kinase 1 [Parasulfuritortus cantonensis]|uniref:Polyphosphate kinase n=1 Tax=Parasulfuritortus cantonensis TaxID=2528202 RepID=A0A4R1BH73_9PROT|nr:polyphosphate kinase 1 [Parasulfuritortus cantonensis]TCJ16514.1 polyphosphate kinase 1 [Parasulfuritortus cantonensis]
MSLIPSSEFLINRELGILEFNRRVLAQAEDAATPLLERLRFLCIFSSNMDEFFEIRVAGLKEQMRLNPQHASVDGLNARQVFKEVAKAAHAMVTRQYELLNNEVLPALAEQGIRFHKRTEWTPEQEEWIREYFYNDLMPVLTPIGLDPSHPFPNVLNKSLNFAVELAGKDAFGRSSGKAVVQAPRSLPRVIQLPAGVATCEYSFVFLSSILHAHVGALFAGMEVHGCYQFRATRNSDLFIDEEENKNLREQLQGELPHRHFGNAVRLEVADNCSESMKEFLLNQFHLTRDDLYQVRGPVNLVRLMNVPEKTDRQDLKFQPFVQGLPAALADCDDMFAAISAGDILLHHPFQSFQPVIDFVRQAADDPAVLAIKQTVYRTGTDSELMRHLIAAAQRGKEVTVVVELLARFDEEANINWAEKLEAAGAHVIYGVVGHKTHAKMAMVVRRENGKIKRYCHLGTGNYHARTARLYTDFGLLTCHPAICQDVNDVFMQITGLGSAGEHDYLWQSPFSLHPNVIRAIENETERARNGEPARIVAKMNALLEPRVIGALYEASQAGVQIDLVVRAVCALRPGIPGISENIRVRSVIGRFLEHHRVFYFWNGGEEDVYLSSADWMDRNFFRRIETCFPVLDDKLKKRVIAEGITPYLKDTLQAWEMQPDGSYRKRQRRGRGYSAQEHLLKLLASKG